MRLTRHHLLILPAALLISIIPAFSQQNQPNSRVASHTSIWDKLVFGGNVGLQFGDVTVIDVSPSVGYKLTDNFLAGIGITYMYFKDSRYKPSFSSDVYGGRVFARYYIPLDLIGQMESSLFLHTEYEILDYDALFTDPFQYLRQKRITAHNVYLGGGFRQPVSDDISFDILVLYNLNHDIYSLYENPLIRVGFNIGI